MGELRFKHGGKRKTPPGWQWNSTALYEWMNSRKQNVSYLRRSALVHQVDVLVSPDAQQPQTWG